MGEESVNPDVLLMLARALIGLMFVQSSFAKLAAAPPIVAASRAHHIPAAGALVRLAGACELVGGTMLVLGVGARLAACLLTLFMISVTLGFLRFWSAPADQKQTQTMAFFSNLTTIGGLMYVAVCGPGTLAVTPAW